MGLSYRVSCPSQAVVLREVPAEAPLVDRLVLVELHCVLLHGDGGVAVVGEVPDVLDQLVLLVRSMAAPSSLLTTHSI